MFPARPRTFTALLPPRGGLKVRVWRFRRHRPASPEMDGRGSGISGNSGKSGLSGKPAPYLHIAENIQFQYPIGHWQHWHWQHFHILTSGLSTVALAKVEALAKEVGNIFTPLAMLATVTDFCVCAGESPGYLVEYPHGIQV